MIDWQAILQRYRDRPLFIDGEDAVSYAQFHEQLISYRNMQETDPLALADLDWNADSFSKLLGNIEAGRSVLIGDDIGHIDLDAFIEKGPFLILKSGGTTAIPRHVVHQYRTFLQAYAVNDRDASRIMILYAADHLAGLDAFMQALHRGSSLVIPPDWTADGVGTAIEMNAVEVLAATPSMLQFLLLGGMHQLRDLSSLHLIVHGAESMPKHLRDRLGCEFPQVRLVNRYGLTEVGALPVYPDPDDPDALILDAEGFQWKVENGELFIKSPVQSLGTLEQGPNRKDARWHATGDLAETTSTGAVRILGRKESVINVGGTKVFASQVEELLLANDAVLDATVFPTRHAITGDSVSAMVVFNGEADVTGLLREVRREAVEKGLPLACAPTRILPVDQLKITTSWKKQRFPDCHGNAQP